MLSLCSLEESAGMSPLVLDLDRKWYSPLVLGKDDDTKGDTVVCLVNLGGAAIGFAGLIEPLSTRVC